MAGRVRVGLGGASHGLSSPYVFGRAEPGIRPDRVFSQVMAQGIAPDIDEARVDDVRRRGVGRLLLEGFVCRLGSGGRSLGRISRDDGGRSNFVESIGAFEE